MKRRTLWLAAVLACQCGAQSQPPSLSGTQITQAQQDKATGKKDVPKSDNKGPGPPSPTFNKQDASANTSDKDNQATKSAPSPPPDYKFFGASIPDWLVGLFTLCLVILGGLQWSAISKQAAYMRHQLKLAAIQTKTSLKNSHAAGESARAAISSAEIAQRTLEITQQANIGIASIQLRYSREFPPPQSLSSDDRMLAWCKIEILGGNVGHSRAEKMSYEFTIFIEDAPAYGTHTMTGGPTTIHAGGQFIEKSPEMISMFEDLVNTTPGMSRAVRLGLLRISGTVRYWDIFGTEFAARCEGRTSEKIDEATVAFSFTTEVEETRKTQQKN